MGDVMRDELDCCFIFQFPKKVMSPLQRNNLRPQKFGGIGVVEYLVSRHGRFAQKLPYLHRCLPYMFWRAARPCGMKDIFAGRAVVNES
jgi:hypothetical protein